MACPITQLIKLRIFCILHSWYLFIFFFSLMSLLHILRNLSQTKLYKYWLVAGDSRKLQWWNRASEIATACICFPWEKTFSSSSFQSWSPQCPCKIICLYSLYSCDQWYLPRVHNYGAFTDIEHETNTDTSIRTIF